MQVLQAELLQVVEIFIHADYYIRVIARLDRDKWHGTAQ